MCVCLFFVFFLLTQQGTVERTYDKVGKLESSCFSRLTDDSSTCRTDCAVKINSYINVCSKGELTISLFGEIGQNIYFLLF